MSQMEHTIERKLTVKLEKPVISMSDKLCASIESLNVKGWIPSNGKRKKA